MDNSCEVHMGPVDDEGYTCDACDGEGWIRNEEENNCCKQCNGDGVVWDD
jgi:DnaJ-class molecular chaperone